MEFEWNRRKANLLSYGFQITHLDESVSIALTGKLLLSADNETYPTLITKGQYDELDCVTFFNVRCDRRERDFRTSDSFVGMFDSFCFCFKCKLIN